MRKKLFKIILSACRQAWPILLFVAGLLLASSFLSPSSTQAQSCTTPAQVSNVLVSYPNCVGDQCDFTKAGCSWSAVTGAANYQVKVTEVETNSQILSQQVAAATTSLSFNITQKRTYKCDVSALNSCGTAGPAGTHSLLCETDAALDSTPTLAPPTATPTLVVKPTLKPGGVMTSIVAAGIVVLFIIGGLTLLII